MITHPYYNSCSTLGPFWSGRPVRFHCDNHTVIPVIQNCNAHQDLLVQLLCCLFFYASLFQLYFLSSTYTKNTQHYGRCYLSKHFDLNVLPHPQAQQIFIPPPIAVFLLTPPDWGSLAWIEQFAQLQLTACPQILQGAHYISFCASYALLSFPLSESSLCRFVASLVSKGTFYSVIRLYFK